MIRRLSGYFFGTEVAASTFIKSYGFPAPGQAVRFLIAG
jgi:hypothetical protein